MKRIALLLIVGIGILPATLFAQAEKRYNEAIANFKRGQYGQAMSQLQPLTVANGVSPQSPYAHYYYALSAQKLKKYPESIQMLKQLINRYPKWEHIEDGFYLLGVVYFELGNLSMGLNYLQRISDVTLSSDLVGLKQTFIGKEKDVLVLKALNKEYPDDYIVAMALMNVLSKNASGKSEQELLARLMKRFDVEMEGQEGVSSRQGTVAGQKQTAGGRKHDKLVVSALLPFRLSEFDPAKRVRTNQFAYDYYQGMLLAREQLKKEGVVVQLQAFDVSNDGEQVKKLIKDASFLDSDLFVGPLYPKTYELAADYVSKKGGVMLNPLSTDHSLLEGYKNIYLAHPSLQFQMKEVAHFAKSVTPNLNVAIYYGTTSKDSAMAALYADEIKGRGAKVLEKVRIVGELGDLSKHVSFFEKEKPSHVVLFSSNSNLGTSLLAVMNQRKLTHTPLIATSGSFDIYKIRSQGFAERLYLLEADFVDVNKDEVRFFQQQYWEKVNTLPSVYSYQGYDHLLFFGRMLKKYPSDIREGLAVRKYDEEFLLSGFNFTRSNENEISPVLRFREGRWAPVK